MSGNNPNHYYGKATIKADGKTYDFDDAVFEPSGVTREPIRNGKGFVEVEKGGKIKGKNFLKKGDSLKELNAIHDATINFTCNTGQVFVCSHAWHTEPTELSKDGYDVEFDFAEHEELVNG